MTHIINGITIEDVRENRTVYDNTSFCRVYDDTDMIIDLLDHGKYIARITVRVSGNICFYESNNSNITIKSIDGYEVINLKEDVKDWTKLLA